MPTYYSKNGNAEVWDTKPDGYLSVEEWIAAQPCPVQPTLADVQAKKRQLINAGFDAAMTASLTMPSASTPPSPFSVYQAIEAWKTDDPDGYATLLSIHEARRASLLAAVEAATTVAEVQAISVTYAV